MVLCIPNILPDCYLVIESKHVNWSFYITSDVFFDRTGREILQCYQAEYFFSALYNKIYRGPSSACFSEAELQEQQKLTLPKLWRRVLLKIKLIYLECPWSSFWQLIAQSFWKIPIWLIHFNNSFAFLEIIFILFPALNFIGLVAKHLMIWLQKFPQTVSIDVRALINLRPGTRILQGHWTW